MSTKMYILFMIIVSFLVNNPGNGQGLPDTADTLIVTDILVMGNEKTKEFVIIREMKTRVGDIFDPDIVERDRQRIQNLRLFNRVEMHALPNEYGVALMVVVTERWYIFPYPILFINERDWRKWSYGAGVINQNWIGRNIAFSGSFWLGYNPGLQFQYFNPWLENTDNLFMDFQLFSLSIRNKNAHLPDFDEKHQGCYIGLGKRWDYRTYLSITFGFRKIITPQKLGLGVSGSGKDQLPSLGLKFIYDSRDLHEFPRDGWYLKFTLNKVSYPHRLDFTYYGLDLRRYQPLLSNISIAGRLALDLSAGRVPLYARKFIGYQERIRGHFYKTREGDHRGMGSIELRLPILKTRYFNLDNGGTTFGGYGQNWPFGISGTLFFDTGVTWNGGQIATKDRFWTGFGCGLNFHLPYVDILRLEYALDMEYNTEWIVDLLVWF